jgi:hypothetical protein
MNSLRHATWRKNKPSVILLITLAAFITSVANAAAEDGTASSWIADANLSGSARASYWNIDKNTDGKNRLAIAEWWLKAAPRLGQESGLVLDGWLRDEGAFNSKKSQGVLREGYLSASLGEADFRLGKQIIVWGRADQLNPTDNLSPRDYTLFSVDSDDQREGTMALKSTYHFAELALTGILLPDFQANKLPIFGANGVVFNESIPKGGQYALKLEQSGQAVDWSLSYFQGYDLNPDIGINSFQAGTLFLSLQHNKIRVLGADAATVLGRYGLRTEAAYTWTEDESGLDPFVKNGNFYGVVGADRTFFEYLNINVQYYVRQVSNYNDPRLLADPLGSTVALQQAVASSQLDAFQQGASVRIGNKWLNETLEAEVAAVTNITYRDYFLRPKLSYLIDDHWKVSFGANIFQGGKDTFFALFKDRSAVFAELRYNY